MQVLENISLKKCNTFGIDANAKYLFSFNSIDALREIAESGLYKNEKQNLVLGGGSNILFTKNFDGIVLKNELKGIECIGEDENHYYVKAAAGERWHTFVLHCINNNYAGVENLSLIPGNVGASPMQNIGAYGVEIKDVFHSLQAFHKKEKTIVEFQNRDCNFGYRESVFKNTYKDEFVILNVTYKLNKKPVFHTQYGAIEKALEAMGIQDLSIQHISEAVIHIRQSKLPDPAIIGNAGSFFKNPVISIEQFKILKNQFSNIVAYPFNNAIKLAAAWLIESCGWKGYRNGDAGCHEKQALVLVNFGHSTGSEIFELSEKIIDSVKSKFGVLLDREVNIY